MLPLKPLPVVVLFMMFSSCMESKPQAAPPEVPTKHLVSAAPARAVIQPPFNYEILLYGADDTRGVIRFAQKPGTNTITLNVYAHDLPADHHYTLQYAVEPVLNGDCSGSNWMNAGNGNADFDMESDRTGAIIEELRMNASDLLHGASFDVKFQLRDHTSEVVLTSDCFPYRLGFKD